ncbi:MAG: hypothetical protein EBS74_03700 [Flavobacteriia bacterium]|nr:hypothetical protein [Flavobacteriia bacterium]
MDQKHLGRRNFIRNSGLFMGAIAIEGSPLLGFHKGSHHQMVVKKLSLLNDQLVEELLPKQLSLDSGRWFGGVKDQFGVPHVHATFNFVFKLGTAYASPYSSFYRSSRVMSALNRAMECVLNVQHPDGTIDLHSTNFHSTPDTAFMVNFLSPVYLSIQKMKDNGAVSLLEKMESFFRKASRCLLVGGAHTANHRWVICAALTRVNRFFPNPKFLNRMQDWLAEGIDLDPDGQFTEKSVGSYSSICDEMFITMGRLLKKNAYLEVARKNLEMTLYYIQPGGELLTDASGRQDSEQIAHVGRYYYAYLYFALLDKNPVFSAVCDYIEKYLSHQIVRFLPYLMEDDFFEQKRVGGTEIPMYYFKRFSHSGVIRIRKNDIDLSVIENNPTFLSFIKGNAVLQSMRLGSTFFGSKGQFIAENAVVLDESIVLSKNIEHGYFQPYPKDKIPLDGDYAKMPRENREMTERQTIEYKITIRFSDPKTASIQFDVTGTENILISLELNFRKGGQLSGVTPDPNREEAFFLPDGKKGSYTHNGSTLFFGPGKSEHQWGTMRGMLEKPSGNTVYITGHTPFHYRLELS